MKSNWPLGRHALIGSLIIAHVWGSMLMLAVLTGSDNNTISDMFGTVGGMIFSTLGVLVGGKAFKDFIPIMANRGAAKAPEEEFDVIDPENNNRRPLD